MIGKNFNFAETFSFLEVKTRRAFVWPSTMANNGVDVLMTTVVIMKPHNGDRVTSGSLSNGEHPP